MHARTFVLDVLLASAAIRDASIGMEAPAAANDELRAIVAEAHRE
jgi:hypothetical protein